MTSPVGTPTAANGNSMARLFQQQQQPASPRQVSQQHASRQVTPLSNRGTNQPEALTPNVPVHHDRKGSHNLSPNLTPVHGHSHSTPSVALPHDGEVGKGAGLKANASAPGMVLGDAAVAGLRAGQFGNAGVSALLTSSGAGGRGSGAMLVPRTHRRTSSSSDAGRGTWLLTPGGSGE